MIAIENGLKGPNYTTVSACASSAHAIVDALNLIRLGKADAIVAGGSEAAVTVPGVGGFNSMKALSTRASRVKYEQTQDPLAMSDS